MVPNLTALQNLGKDPELLHLSLCMQMVTVLSQVSRLPRQAMPATHMGTNPRILDWPASRVKALPVLQRAFISESPPWEKDGRRK